ncbi:hypothetical protein QBC35DRAFT_477087 [Podospora australis]|uniref:Ubiquitin 3 binding protein But2 C-terminal domain-containing protein n=1 Tax=Podospora australis TaxID=1536484 RepID=A0AAN6WQP5_9PEZI|nr:hypothetical protein QBC35DRAFT_477087 [Podospora australis]
MKTIAISAAAWAVALASPLAPAEATRELNIALTFNKLTTQVSIEAYNADRTELLARSCAFSLQDGAFKDFPISFAVDDNGSGNISVQGTAHPTNDDGPVVCDRLYSPTESLVTCSVAVPASVALQDGAIAAECFNKIGSNAGDGPGLAEVFKNMAAAGSDAPEIVSAADAEAVFAQNITAEETFGLAPNSVLGKRQASGECGTAKIVTKLVGNGNPHQNPMNVQLSYPIDCGQGQCSVGATESFTVGWSVSASIGSWLSGGFAVSQSITTGNDYTCYGAKNERVCVWKNQAQTAYTVRDIVQSSKCGVLQERTPVVMWSPNSGGKGSYYYCVHGKNYCRNKGDRWLDKNGRAGGP